MSEDSLECGGCDAKYDYEIDDDWQECEEWAKSEGWKLVVNDDSGEYWYCPECRDRIAPDTDRWEADGDVRKWRDNPYTGRSDLTLRNYPQGLIVLTVRYYDGEYGWELWVGADGHSATLGSGALTAETPDAAKAEALTRAREWAGWLAEQVTGTPRELQEGATLDALARAQGVTPLADVGVLVGTWPGETNDGFEDFVDEARHGKVQSE